MGIISKILRYLKKRHKLVRDVITFSFILLLIVTVGFSIYYRNLHEEKANSMHSTLITNEALKNQNFDLKEQVAKQNIIISEYKVTIEDYKYKIYQLEADLKAEQLANTELLSKLASSVSYPDNDYVQATYVWNYLKNEMGLNDYVAAGILGNIMTEVGGQTLDISKYSCRESNNYYGMCQWAGPRKDRLLNDFGRTLEDQCRFLQVELFEIIPETDSFYQLQDEKEAALYFAKKYERCAKWSYAKRQDYATKALQYFTGTEE